MKKILTLLAIGSCLFGEVINIENKFSIEDKCDQVLKKEAFTICYDYSMKQPKWVAYAIDRKEEKGYNKRPDKAFKEDKEIPLKYRSKLDDFRGSNYDRGHMAPNAIVDYSKKAQMESFLLSNISPQLPSFNRGIWKNLEEEVRKFVKSNEELYIITGAIPGNKTIGNNINVPSAYYKTLYSPSKRNGIGFLIPHEDKLPQKSFFKYKTKIKEIEKITKGDYYSNIRNQQFKNFNGYFK